MKPEDGSPIWQLEQNIKRHEAVAQTSRADAERQLRRAAEADEQAERFRLAVAILKAAGDSKKG